MRKTPLLVVTTMLLGAAVLGGCTGPDGYVMYKDVRRDISPELQGTVERPVDVDAHLVVNNNANIRMITDDLGRAFYTNRPSALSPFPVVYTSGMPR